MSESMLDWGWKVAGAVGSAAVPVLVGLLFRSPKISGERCENCQRCSDYQVVGGSARHLATMLGLAGFVVVLVGTYLALFDKVSLELGAAIIACGFLNELLWLRIARQYQNALKCIACGDIQSLVIRDIEDALKADMPSRKTRRKRSSRKQR